MRILACSIGQSIKIGDDITIQVLSCHEFQIQIGVEAPEDTPVQREDIYLRIHGADNENDNQ